MKKQVAWFSESLNTWKCVECVDFQAWESHAFLYTQKNICFFSIFIWLEIIVGIICRNLFLPRDKKKVCTFPFMSLYLTILTFFLTILKKKKLRIARWVGYTGMCRIMRLKKSFLLFNLWQQQLNQKTKQSKTKHILSKKSELWDKKVQTFIYLFFHARNRLPLQSLKMILQITINTFSPIKVHKKTTNNRTCTDYKWTPSS